MSVSAVFGARIAVPSAPSPHRSTKPTRLAAGGCASGLTIECSSRPQKKATKHHMKTRPKKTQPWDKRREPTVYAPFPPLPPDWTLVSSAAEDFSGAEAAVAPQAPVSSG